VSKVKAGVLYTYRMLVFRKGVWHTVAVPTDPMLSHAHKQRLAACLASGGTEKEFYQELFPGLVYPKDQESLGLGLGILAARILTNPWERA